MPGRFFLKKHTWTFYFTLHIFIIIVKPKNKKDIKEYHYKKVKITTKIRDEKIKLITNFDIYKIKDEFCMFPSLNFHP